MALCRRCFLLAEIDSLGRGLAGDDVAHAAIEAHLERAYRATREAYEARLVLQAQVSAEIVYNLLRYASETRRSGSESKSESEG